MRELALHILDITKNSTVAGGTKITINLSISPKNNLISFEIVDNGKGMSEEMVKSVCDPFTTTRTTRKVGLGLPLLKMSAEACDGVFKITSKLGFGTTVYASFKLDHIDRSPLGDIGSTIAALIMGDPQVNFVVNVDVDGENFCLDTEVVKEQMQDIPIDSVEVLEFIKEFINENLKSLYGGSI